MRYVRSYRARELPTSYASQYVMQHKGEWISQVSDMNEHLMRSMWMTSAEGIGWLFMVEIRFRAKCTSKWTLETYIVLLEWEENLE